MDINVMYKVKVFNNKNEKISRDTFGFPPEQEITHVIDDRALKLIKACRPLEIKGMKYICKICGSEHNSKRGLIAHITMAHPEKKHLIKGKK